LLHGKIEINNLKNIKKKMEELKRKNRELEEKFNDLTKMFIKLDAKYKHLEKKVENNCKLIESNCKTIYINIYFYKETFTLGVSFYTNVKEDYVILKDGINLEKLFNYFMVYPNEFDVLEFYFEKNEYEHLTVVNNYDQILNYLLSKVKKVKVCIDYSKYLLLNCTKNLFNYLHNNLYYSSILIEVDDENCLYDDNYYDINIILSNLRRHCKKNGRSFDIKFNSTYEYEYI
jgi:hypothetical protein